MVSYFLKVSSLLFSVSATEQPSKRRKLNAVERQMTNVAVCHQLVPGHDFKPPDPLLFRRQLLAFCAGRPAAILSHRITFIIGPRRSGKSTLIGLLLPRLPAAARCVLIPVKWDNVLPQASESVCCQISVRCVLLFGPSSVCFFISTAPLAAPVFSCRTVSSS